MRLSTLCAGAFWLLSGCNFDEADLYTEEELPWFPGIPDTDLGVCNDCMQAHCADERAACVRHDDCRERLACAGLCRDPNCINACDSEAFLRQRECESDGSGGIGLPECMEGFDRMRALARCGESACVSECNVGRNWDCAGGYAFNPGGGPIMGGERILVRHKVNSFGDQDFLAGIPNVEITDLHGTLESSLGTTSTMGWEEFEQGAIGGVVPPNSRFVGHDPSFPVRALRYLGRKRVRPDSVVSLTIVENKAAFFFPEDHLPDYSKANVGVLGMDCLGATFGVSPLFTALDVDITLENAESAVALHYDNANFYGLAETAGNAGSNGAFLDVTATDTASPVNVVMCRRSDGEEVGRTSNVRLEAGFFTNVHVLPLHIE